VTSTRLLAKNRCISGVSRFTGARPNKSCNETIGLEADTFPRRNFRANRSMDLSIFCIGPIVDEQ
jgi:hypothetical protein